MKLNVAYSTPAKANAESVWRVNGFAQKLDL
jgi:hypothetical protein